MCLFELWFSQGICPGVELKANSKNYLSNSGLVSFFSIPLVIAPIFTGHYHVPGILLCSWDTGVSKTDVVLVLMGFTFYWKGDHQQVNQ